MVEELKSRAHSYGQNCFHMIWCPKYRRPYLKPRDVKKVCEGVLRLVALQNEFVIHELKILSDHIHLFIEIPPRISVSKAFQLLKGVSARVLKRNYRYLQKFKNVWSKGKFFRSVGNVSKDVVENYIKKSQGNWDYFNTRRVSYYDSQISLKAY